MSYDDLFQVVKSGRNRDNVRKHISTIRDAFREIDPEFDAIENVPMRDSVGLPPRCLRTWQLRRANADGRKPFRA